ncbi:hypothetical protein GCM10011297_20780 [Bacterioplanes sanyensis]|uniref:DUF3325 family protein n=1 Tax=Bacterioplanes sanyensis TaxID=1249553 RepID=UPI0016783913|nr:DUF3325 family protein [Bacterioplanes sanyensis]GGY47788.1 hypothetical protein GCM10011297_20780 [Bacterioplanes sanyensis]
MIWPALHLMYGVSEHRSQRIARSRKLAGLIFLLFSLAWMGHPFGWEQGSFYWLFSLVACAAIFVQLRIWWPRSVIAITLISAAGGAYVGLV